MYFQFVGDPVLYIQQFIVFAHVSPWRPHLQNNMVMKEALKPAFRITNVIEDFQFSYGYVICKIFCVGTFTCNLSGKIFVRCFYGDSPHPSAGLSIWNGCPYNPSLSLHVFLCSFSLDGRGIIQCLWTSCVANVSLIWLSKGFQFVPSIQHVLS